jgi:hypothetical protein
MRPWAKVGVVCLGLAAAFILSCLAVFLRQFAISGPDLQASSGMHAFGDLLFGIAVFGLLALIPISLTLYWLRPVARFWSILAGAAVLSALTGIFALAANMAAQDSTGGWIFLAEARVGLMPLNALNLAACALFAPRVAHRWLLIAAAVSDGAIFTGVFLVKLVLPALGRG